MSFYPFKVLLGYGNSMNTTVHTKEDFTYVKFSDIVTVLYLLCHNIRVALYQYPNTHLYVIGHPLGFGLGWPALLLLVLR